MAGKILDLEATRGLPLAEQRRWSVHLPSHQHGALNSNAVNASEGSKVRQFQPNKQNQTDPQFLKEINAGFSHCGDQDDQESNDLLGVGVFVIPDVESSKTPCFKKILVDDLTYDQCVQRGMWVEAFKWIPKSEFKELSELRSQCSGACVDTCVGIGCVCVGGRCI